MIHPSPSVPQPYDFQRQIPIEAGYDLIVAGCGSGGRGAAISADRLGAKVLLVESMGCLGGMGTSAMVSAWSDLGDGNRMLAGGLMGELVETRLRSGYHGDCPHPARVRD